MTSMSGIWDVHHHWVNETSYIDRLLREMDRLGIERAGLIALGDLIPDLFILHGPRVGSVDNGQLAKLVQQQPDRFWGWGFIRLGQHETADVDRLADMGLAGLKFHAPLQPYDTPEYFAVLRAGASPADAMPVSHGDLHTPAAGTGTAISLRKLPPHLFGVDCPGISRPKDDLCASGRLLER